MPVLDFKINNKKIVATATDFLEGYELSFLKRISPELWKYHTNYFIFKPNTSKPNSFFLDFDSLKKGFDPYNEIIADMFLYNKDSEGIKSIPLDESFDFKDFDGSVELDCGVVNFHVYKNGNNSISIKIKFVPTYKFTVNSIVEDEQSLTFDFTTNSKKNYKFYFARRSYLNHSNNYNAFFEVKPKKNQITINKLGFLLPFAKATKEQWDLIAEVDGFYITFETSEKLQTEYFDISSALLAKVFVSENKYVSIYTKYSDNKSQPKIKVAVLGSCFTRRFFVSADFYNNDYKKFYEVGKVCFHQTMASLVSEPVPFNKELLEGTKFPVDADRFSQEIFEKKFFDDLKESKPDYLVIDQFADANHPIIECTDGKIVNSSYFLKETKLIESLNVKRIYDVYDGDRFELYKKSVDKFVKKIKTIIPEEKIVIVCCQPALKRMVDGKLQNWGANQQFVDAMAELWKQNDNYLVSQLPKANVIDMRDPKYYSVLVDGAIKPEHMASDFYQDGFNKFNKIVLRDLIAKR